VGDQCGFKEDPLVTEWLGGVVARDDNGFILTGPCAGADNLLETAIRGVFAAGDVRAGSTKRRASAVEREHEQSSSYTRTSRQAKRSDDPSRDPSGLPLSF
jgi:thioredoxin reductase